MAVRARRSPRGRGSGVTSTAEPGEAHVRARHGDEAEAVEALERRLDMHAHAHGELRLGEGEDDRVGARVREGVARRFAP